MIGEGTCADIGCIHTSCQPPSLLGFERPTSVLAEVADSSGSWVEVGNDACDQTSWNVGVDKEDCWSTTKSKGSTNRGHHTLGVSRSCVYWIIARDSNSSLDVDGDNSQRASQVCALEAQQLATRVDSQDYS